ncbi:hypothetical protein TEA_004042 [Camellia sinensis var. sinensis]|uniref:Uncharacterized protein n=1 Tax=Camellia sinensis var. sinensis TaxID=542762 RepID=A0A4S4ESJ8_CAMSN|nr:hypothetical protein TEA_004042 [Camellia sinensis var. sinensis]
MVEFLEVVHCLVCCPGQFFLVEVSLSYVRVGKMPRFDDRHGSARLYVGRLSTRTRSRDLEGIFSRYGRVRNVDMKRDFAFVEFSDSRDADDARYSLNGRDVDGSRITVEFAKGGPRGPGGSREYLGRGPPPGTGRCFNCGLDGHWARDCKAGDWKNKCYRYVGGATPGLQLLDVAEAKVVVSARSHSYSRSRSPQKRERSIECIDRRSRSPRPSRSPKPNRASPLPSPPPPSRVRKHSPTPEERSPQERGSPSPRDRKRANGSEYSESPKSRSRSRSPIDDDAARESPRDGSPVEENGRSRSPSPVPGDDRSPVDDDDDNHGSLRGSESA